MNRLLISACTTVAVFLAVGVGAEILLRAKGFDPVDDLRRAGVVVIRRSENPALGYELTPLASGVAWGSEVRVNADGFRDRDYPRAKPAGVRRIVVLGDSVTMGSGLTSEQTFPKRLEASLAPERVEVLNLAVPGYDSLQEAALLEQIGFSYEPDLVLVAFCVNDVGVHSLSLEYMDGLARYDSPIYHLRIAQWWAVVWERRGSADWTAWVNGEAEFTRRFGACSAPIDGDAELEAWRRSLADFCAGYATRLDQHVFLPWYTSASKLGRLRWVCERFAKLGREHGVALDVVFLPFPKAADYPEAYATVHAIVAHECARAGLPYLDAASRLDVGQLSALRMTPRDALHLSAEGHAVVAKELKHACLAALNEKR